MPEIGAGRLKGAATLDVRPVRFIAYAWGDKYTEELLSLTLPAVLAPGNLPAVVELAPTEVVLLIQQEHRDLVASHPTIRRMQQLCSVRLVGLDDLIVNKEKYGVTLTYALHRGMRAFGADVTETNFLFLNADFIVADGSLRSAVLALMQGERLVAAPSYCAVGDKVRAKLRQFVDHGSGSLSVPPRELARLALRYLHNTVKGKTLNQSNFHLAQMDQFYWRVDDDTLLGHQMPVAIVGMRPEQPVDEPNTYWDHGLISEFCPDTQPYVLGDSDDFLMVELRDRRVAIDQIVAGPLDRSLVAQRMIGWVTPYQCAFTAWPLTLHAEDVPLAAPGERAKLAAAVAEIFRHAPQTFPSHRNHPQWDYHLSPFMEARHQRLSLQLGNATEQSAPPANLTPIDQLWWRLDGARKRRDRRRAGSGPVIFFEERLAADPASALEASIASQSRPHRTVELVDVMIERPPVDAQSGPASRDQAIEAEIGALERSYATLLRKHVTSAMIPLVNVLHLAGEPESSRRNADSLRGFRPAIGRRLRLAFHQSALREARKAVAKAVAEGARDALVVVGDVRLGEELTPAVPGFCMSVSSQGVGSGNLAYSLTASEQFDLCVWELSADELMDLPRRVEALRPYFKTGAVIVGLCSNDDGFGQSERASQSWIGAASEVHFGKASRVAPIVHRFRHAFATHGLRGVAAVATGPIVPIVRRARHAIARHGLRGTVALAAKRIRSKKGSLLWCRPASSGRQPPSAVTVVLRIPPAITPWPEEGRAASTQARAISAG
jgi:hypothetical protein